MLNTDLLFFQKVLPDVLNEDGEWTVKDGTGEFYPLNGCRLRGVTDLDMLVHKDE